MRNSNIKDCEASVLLHRAVSSERNIIDSMDLCILIYHITGAWMTNSNQPVCENLVFLLAEREESTEPVNNTGRPHVSGLQ